MELLIVIKRIHLNFLILLFKKMNYNTSGMGLMAPKKSKIRKLKFRRVKKFSKTKNKISEGQFFETRKKKFSMPKMTENRNEKNRNIEPIPDNY